MNVECRVYHLKGFTPLLGSQPASDRIRSEFIAPKAPTPELGDAETEMLPGDDDKGMTVFLRDADSTLVLMDYTIVGFFKAAIAALKAENGIAQAKSKVGTYLFVEPRAIPIYQEGDPVVEPDGVLERPLRAETMKGPRVSLAASELVKDPWEITITVKLLDNESTAKSKRLTFNAVESALDYGALKGLGQWRNGGYGRFTWERVDERHDG